MIPKIIISIVPTQQLMATFAQWKAERAVEDARRARVLRGMKRRRKPKPPELQSEAFTRVARTRLKLRATAEMDGAEVEADLLPGTRIRVLDQRKLPGGTHRVQVALDTAGGRNLKAIGWASLIDKHGGETLLKIDPSRDGISPNAEAADWVAAQGSEEQHMIERAWLAVLSRDQFRVLRMKQTEDAHSGAYTDWWLPGSYACVGCGLVLYSSSHKFQSNTGWPSFCDNVPGTLERVPGRNQEIVCASCSGHIGHVFVHPKHPAPRQERHCVNSVCLRFVPSPANQQRQAERTDMAATQGAMTPAPAPATDAEIELLYSV